MPYVVDRFSMQDRMTEFPWARLCILLFAVSLFVLGMAAPIFMLVGKSFYTQDIFVGLSNYAHYFNNPTYLTSLGNTLWVGLLVVLISVPMTYIYAYALNRSRLPAKGLLRVISLLPVLAPSLMPAISLVYLFGNQGILNKWLFDQSIYGPIGVVIGLVFWVFPHVFMIMNTALSSGDNRHYDAARAMGAGKLRIFFTVTLPSVKYGLLSAAFVAFTLAITDFGVPKVIGGQFNMLSTDIFKQVIGQQNFSMGATLSVLMLLPAVLSFIMDRWLNRRQAGIHDHRAEVYCIPENKPRDILLGIYCLSIAAIFIGIIGMAVYASFISFWPYSLTFTLEHYAFDVMDGGGWDAYYNSLYLAVFSALLGGSVVVMVAYLAERLPGFNVLRGILQIFTLMPLAVPGMVLGLSYIFFFNQPNNPLGFIYGSMTILVLSTVVHYYTVSHLTLVTGLKKIPSATEDVSLSLKVPLINTFFKVVVPACARPIGDVSLYLFVNAMTTVSAVVFLYSPDTILASISILNMDGAGDIAPAAAMSTVIFSTCVAAKLVHWAISHYWYCRNV